MIDPHLFANWVSDEAKAAYAASAAAPAAPDGLDALRAHYDAFNRRMLAAALALHPVAITERTSGGVPVHIVTPAAGATDVRVLICLHGGAFMWGAGAGALLEAVPLAAVTGMEVVAVDYRLAPEHRFPAAVDDVVAVFADLLTRFDHTAIGIYGCSAGGVLTAQAVARLVHEGRPNPGAIAMLHGTALDFEGDSAASAPAYDLRANPGSSPGTVPSTAQLPYFADADLAEINFTDFFL